jgi:hypothetical protein
LNGKYIIINNKYLCTKQTETRKRLRLVDVHLEAVTVGILRSKEKGVQPALSMFPRLNKKHQPLQLLLSF